MSHRVTPLPLDAALTSDEAYEAVLTTIKIPVIPPPAPPAPAPAVSHNAFFDSMRDPKLQVHGPTLNPTSETANLTLTDNHGITLASTESPQLDLFTELGSVASSSLPPLLDAAWAEDSLETLKIIWNARSIPRGKGKKDAWVRGAAYLAERHPQTLLRNLSTLVEPTDLIPKKRKADTDAMDVEAKEDGKDDGDLCEVEEDPELGPRTARSHGYFKDLLNLLALSSLPSETTPSGSQLSVAGDYTRVPGLFVDRESPYAKLRTKAGKTKQADADVKHQQEVADATRLAQLLSADGSFHRALHLTVTRIFGFQLRADLEALQAATACRAAKADDEARAFESRISLAAKWAPTEGGFHDNYTRIASSIAEFLTPLDGPRTSSGVVRALKVYRSKYLAPLRKHLDLVEVAMSAGEWKKIKYSRVPSIAMSKLSPILARHDQDGFTAYLLRVAEGKATISGAAMTPAKILQQATNGHGIEKDVAEAQWKTLVNSIRDEGKLSRCIAVADVSGSMWSPVLPDDGTTPIDSSLALSILIAQVTEPPFANAIISFTDTPKFIDLVGTSLAEHRHQIESQGLGYNTNFIATFQEILKRATLNKLTQDSMVERLFVFSDMEFDQCHTMGDSYATHYEVVEKAYKDAGYEMPELVFWNLASGQKKTSKPVKATQPGVALVSGYSAAIVKVFLAGADFGEPEDEDAFEEVEEVDEESGDVVMKKRKTEITPVGVMRKAIGHTSFDGLKVYD